MLHGDFCNTLQKIKMMKEVDIISTESPLNSVNDEQISKYQSEVAARYVIYMWLFSLLRFISWYFLSELWFLQELCYNKVDIWDL